MSGVPIRGRLSQWGDHWAFLAVCMGVLLLYATAPKGGSFWWSDAPRHALNGVFVSDFIRAMPLDDPAGFAYRYYSQYPALTILFYPPLFYVLSAPIYALFGASHEVALLALMLHYLAFGWGAYRLANLWMPSPQACLMALTLLGVPEIAFWGRQVMLEVPAFAFVVWSACFFVNHLRSDRTADLFWAIALLVLGMYTKISVAFLALVYAAVVLHHRGVLSTFRDRRIWLLTAFSVLSLVPLVVLTVKFGQANVQSVTGVADRVAARDSLAGWLWYAQQIPSQLGWPLFVVTVLSVVSVLAYPFVTRSQGDQVSEGRAGKWGPRSRSEHLLMGLWLLVGYLFFSAIDLKEARHSVYLLLPVLMWPVVRLACMPRAAIGTAAVVLMVGAAWLWTMCCRPPLFVDGYAAVARYVGDHAPKGSSVLFSGYRDGAFTFNIRTLKDRPDLSVVRADKLLLRVAVRRELGVEQKQWTDADLLDRINRSAIHYLVVQPGFWSDLAAMQQFERLLAEQAQFVEVARFQTPANHRTHERVLVVYRNSAASSELVPQVIELPIINRSVPSLKSTP